MRDPKSVFIIVRGSVYTGVRKHTSRQPSDIFNRSGYGQIRRSPRDPTSDALYPLYALPAAKVSEHAVAPGRILPLTPLSPF